ncbi:MAG: T9SS C-terminal target domain-containing protein [Bacteroidetes bacterium]|nr:MAG: T9SS C-terminal target domain-containing protein [Bacteroidota bacterium]
MSNAINLNSGDPCVNGTTVGSGLQGGEYLRNCVGGGFNPNQSVWYSFTAGSSTGGIIISNWTGCSRAAITLYGPSPSCVPGLPQYIGCLRINSSPFYVSLSSLVVGQTYLVQITYDTGGSCGSGTSFCISYTDVPNDDCANATTLTVGTNQCSSALPFSSMDMCTINYSSLSETGNLWYRFTATNDSMVLNIFDIAQTSGAYISAEIYGPFAPGGGCGSGCSMYMQSIPLFNIIPPFILPKDPGEFELLTGLSVGSDYLIAIQNNSSGGLNDNFCIGVHEPASNSTPQKPALIDNCGTTFNGVSEGGYWDSGCGAKRADLDCDGDNDASFVFNNPSWFYFCATSAGTWNVQFDVGSCVLGYGTQMSILRGPATAFTSIEEAPSPSAPSSSWTSSNFAVASGECIYLVVDGFAGDACNYSYVLTNVTGGCNLLPVEQSFFDAVLQDGKVIIQWETASELNNDYFIVERSKDGEFFEPVGERKGQGTSSLPTQYYMLDTSPYGGVSYYRLKQVDFDGTEEIIGIKRLYNPSEEKIDVNIKANPFSRELIININGYQEDKCSTGSLKIYDVSGHLVYESSHAFNSMENTLSVNTNHIAEGIYMVSFAFNNTLYTSKIVIR